MSRFWKICCWTFGLFIGLAGIALIAAYLYGTRCKSDVLSSPLAPGNVEATAIYELCYSDLIFVRLKDQESGEEKIVFHYTPINQEIYLKWIDPNHLDITIPVVDTIGLKMDQWDGVEITYHIRNFFSAKEALLDAAKTKEQK